MSRLRNDNQVLWATVLVLATFDKALLHLAGEHERHVLVLEAN